MYTSYKKDDDLKELILNIHNFIQSTPYPKKWLEEKVELFNLENISFEQTECGKIIFQKAKDELQGRKIKTRKRTRKNKIRRRHRKICSYTIRRYKKNNSNTRNKYMG
ncbi:MAG: hypothetical protein HFJ52_05535 [Clostridia bacterium]|nr:hypothetical protein [Clostridia bacterium]